MSLSRDEVRRGAARRVVQVAGSIGLWSVLLFASSGTLDWTGAWAYLALTALMMLLSFAWVWRANPEVIAIRSRGSSRGTKPFDKVIAPFFLAAMLGLPVVAGLDQRFDWAVLPSWTLVPGAVLVFLGHLPIAWSLAHNPHLEKTVRIQDDRGHRVISTGPYAWVRHPMYAGVCVQHLGLPLLLGSAWALVPGLAMILVLAVRIRFEEQALLADLPGYAGYVREGTRYRLVPGVW